MKKSVRMPVAALLAAALWLALPAHDPARSSMTLRLTSPAFTDGGEIPEKFTCEGADVSPPLQWRGVPEGAKSLVLIVDDPDAPDPAAPKLTWVHWVLFDLPAKEGGLPEDADKAGYPAGAGVGSNDWKRPGYGGPCPPVGRHRYFHKLYALDAALGLKGHPAKAQVEAAMRGHVLAETQLIGTYRKKR